MALLYQNKKISSVTLSHNFAMWFFVDFRGFVPIFHILPLTFISSDSIILLTLKL